MPDIVSVDETSNKIVIKTFNDTSVADMKRSRELIVEINRRLGLSKVFVDASKLSSLPAIPDLLQFVSDLPSEFVFAILIPDARALVNVKDKSNALGVQVDLELFREMALDKHKNVQLFSSKNEANAWLSNIKND